MGYVDSLKLMRITTKSSIVSIINRKIFIVDVQK